ncbi:MAG: hypothetical protein GY796_33925, partial [Chloroflexi bacterium]|nr:hypothetical protein [Chloroflexota bacterium]
MKITNQTHGRRWHGRKPTQSLAKRVGEIWTRLAHLAMTTTAAIPIPRTCSHITAADGQTNDYFGAAVAFNETGQGLLVGAYWEDEAASNAGAAYYFTSDGTTWTEQAKLIPANAGPSDHFGIAV